MDVKQYMENSLRDLKAEQSRYKEYLTRLEGAIAFTEGFLVDFAKPEAEDEGPEVVEAV